ncbi:MAG: hypothetical protein IK066_11185 [Kiritimatiellae bacterium]|nr:hypothetical protein [Kiritimatiellia bacterium]
MTPHSILPRFRRAVAASAFLALALAALPAAAQNLRVDWAYHAAEGADPAAVAAPGLSESFLTPPAAPGAPASILVLTDRDFGGPLDEQVGVRWWDGRMAHWITGVWIKNVTAADLPAASPLAEALPQDRVFDLWRVTIPSWIPQPGDNYYAVQLKATGRGDPLERYLLARGGGDFSRTNGLGQVWSSSEEFDGQDWLVTVPENAP